MEYKWISGWKCELIHCPNGRVEQDTVFNEIFSAPFLLGDHYGKTTWTAVLHDPNHHRLHFRLDNAISTSLYKIEMKADGANRSRCRLELTYSAQNKKGSQIIANYGAEKMRFMIAAIMKMLKHYCEKGEVLNPAAVARISLRFKYFSTMDRIRLLLNGLAMALMRDPDRKRYLAGLPVSKTSGAA